MERRRVLTFVGRGGIVGSRSGEDSPGCTTVTETDSEGFVVRNGCY